MPSAKLLLGRPEWSWDSEITFTLAQPMKIFEYVPIYNRRVRDTLFLLDRRKLEREPGQER